jgi:hypothetical protein
MYKHRQQRPPHLFYGGHASQHVHDMAALLSVLVVRRTAEVVELLRALVELVFEAVELGIQRLRSLTWSAA